MRLANLRAAPIKFIKILFGVSLLLLAVRQIDWSVFKIAIQNVNVGWLLIALASVLTGLAIKVARWVLLLRNYRINRPLYRVINAYFIGQAANILLFIRGGEVLRIGWLHSKDEDDLVAITATVAFEKYLDLVMLVGVTMIVSSNLPPIASVRLNQLRSWLAGTSFLLLAVIVFGPWFWEKISAQKSFSGWIGKLQNKIDRFVKASLWLRNPERLLPSFAISTVIWFVMAMTNILLFRALNIHTGWEASSLVLVLVYIGVLPALMPGNIGPFTYFAQLALIPFEIGPSTALAFAVLLYGIVTIPPLIIAGIMLLYPRMQETKSP